MFRFLLFLTLSFSIPAVAQLEENLLLHYKFDGDALDASSNNHDGFPSGVVFVEDRNGNPASAAYFDGIDDFIDLPNIENLKPNFPISFSFYIKYESTNVEDRAVFDTSFADDVSSGVFFNSEASTGKHAVNHGDGTPAYNSGTRRTYVSNGFIQTDNWYHIAIVLRSSTDMEIYVNCKNLGGEHSGTGGPLQYTSSAGSIGRHDRDIGSQPLYFKGALDDFRYWNRAITVSEIISLCESVVLGTDENIVNDAQIYPNPATDVIYIDPSGLMFNEYRILDTFGRLKQSGKFTNELNLENLSNGIFFLQLIDDAKVITKKILIQK